MTCIANILLGRAEEQEKGTKGEREYIRENISELATAL